MTLACFNAPESQRVQLTEREVDILTRIASGERNKEIANALKISQKTVEYHRANLHTKIGVESAVMLTRYAVQVGLVPL